MYPLTPWVKRLLVANIVMFIATQLAPQLYGPLMLVPMAVVARPWTVVTYMFLHAGLLHILFNMIGLFFFGPRLEERLGGRDFLWLYFLGGIGGAAGSFIFARNAPVIGASAAVYAVLVGFAVFWPRERIYIWGVLPVEAWLLAAILIVITLWSGFTGAQSGVAHFAHLGGIVFGYAYLRVREWHQGAPRREFQKKVNEIPSSQVSDRAALKRWQGIDLGSLHEINRDEVELLLKKVEVLGVRSLSPEERAFLDRMAGSYH